MSKTVIGLFPSLKKGQALHVAAQVRTFLQEKGVAVVSEDETATQIGATPLSSIDEKELQFLVAIGGDGTILRLAHRFRNLDAPILGINLGHLGFMADVPVSDIYPSLSDLLSGSFTVDKRLILDGCHPNQCELTAVNDIVFHRGSNYSLIELSIHVDGTYVNTFVADGIIVATPNGSTAYSLAAGGPILSPSIDAFAITPICPHTTSNRPIILTADRQVHIQYLSPYDPIEVRADGMTPTSLKTGESLLIKRSSRTFNLVHLPRHDYFSTLRTKLGWSGKLR